MKKKSVIKLVVLCLLAAQLAVGATILSGSLDAAPLCTRNADNGCDNNGCENTGGVCGRAIAAPKFGDTGDEGLTVIAASKCWCLY